jgi:predicted O-methyltransferase YrrM
MINVAIERYFYSLLPERDPVLREMEAQAAQRHIPIVGPAVGRLLFQLAKLIGAQSVFELGSAIGYSTLWWARAVGEPGRVVYTDSDERNAREARGYFEQAGAVGRIDVRTGDALDLLAAEPGPFDIIFNDVDKQYYPRVFHLALPRLRPGGLFISDNVLWHGRVAEPVKPHDAATQGILEFNQLLYACPEPYTTILPLRDGVAVCWKQAGRPHA